MLLCNDKKHTLKSLVYEGNCVQIFSIVVELVRHNKIQEHEGIGKAAANRKSGQEISVYFLLSY